jgi:RHS repeat-associated protein
LSKYTSTAILQKYSGCFLKKRIFVPAVLSASDYYAFGMEMPGRTFSAGAYRYGFNGKENDRGNFGTQLVQDYGMRLYNPAIGKFLSVDPIADEYPWNSPYSFAENDVIRSIDLDGEEKMIVTKRIEGGMANTYVRFSSIPVNRPDNTGNTFRWFGTLPQTSANNILYQDFDRCGICVKTETAPQLTATENSAVQNYLNSNNKIISVGNNNNIVTGEYNILVASSTAPPPPTTIDKTSTSNTTRNPSSRITKNIEFTMGAATYNAPSDQGLVNTLLSSKPIPGRSVKTTDKGDSKITVTNLVTTVIQINITTSRANLPAAVTLMNQRFQLMQNTLQTQYPGIQVVRGSTTFCVPATQQGNRTNTTDFIINLASRTTTTVEKTVTKETPCK